MLLFLAGPAGGGVGLAGGGAGLAVGGAPLRTGGRFVLKGGRPTALTTRPPLCPSKRSTLPQGFSTEKNDRPKPVVFLCKDYKKDIYGSFAYEFEPSTTFRFS